MLTGSSGAKAESPLVLVTGATGFIGRALLPALLSAGYRVRVACRSAEHALGIAVQTVVVQDLTAVKDWAPLVRGVGLICHLAARVHQMQPGETERDDAYLAMNRDVPLHLARAAKDSGCRRFVFLSSIKVNGECTTGTPFRAADTPHPLDAYGRSKLAAETALLELCRNSAMDVVVIRPPLVYGPGVKGNFRSMMQAVQRGIPLPLSSIRNRRSLVSVGNLVDLIVHCLESAAASNRVLLAGDGRSLSTPALLRAVGEALGRPARLLPFPPALLQSLAVLAGRGEQMRRLCESLEVDIEATCELLDWTPCQSVEEGLAAAAAPLQAREPA